MKTDNAPSDQVGDSKNIGDKSWDVSPIQPDFKYSGETVVQKKSTDATGVTAKSATADWTGVTSFDNLKPDPNLDIFALVQHVPAENVKRLPEKLIDGKKAVGFQLDETKTNKFGTTIWRHTWWVDPNTKLPVRLEVIFRGDDPQSGIDERIISDIVFNAPIEQSLFSLESPKDYRPLEVVVQEMYSPKASGPVGKKTEFVFADVQDEVAKTKSVQYTDIRTNRNKDGTALSEETTEVKVLGTGIERRETTKTKAEKQPKDGTILFASPPHNIYVYDANTGKSIFLFPDKKIYDIPQTVISISDGLKATAKKIDTKPHPEADFYARIHDLPADPVKRLPEKVIGGKKVVGFVYEDKHESPYGVDKFERTFWVDPTTKLPVRIETKFRTTNTTVVESDWVTKDFVFDAPLDEKLFSTDPPAGWTDAAKQPVDAIQKSWDGAKTNAATDKPGN
jgi:outer membrane lipoprotein-sorting protein